MRTSAFAKRDANHNELVSLYRQLGCSVYETHELGFGFPDAVVGAVGVTELVEFKTEDGDYTAAQRTFMSEWRGAKVRTMRCAQDVIDHVQEIRRRVTPGGLTA